MTKDKKPSSLQVILPVIAAIVVAYIGYLGIKYQADSSKNSTSESTVDEATIKFVVLDKATGDSITGATIILQIDVMPSETNVTDTDGVARFFLKPESIGLHGFLRIEADGYKSQKRDIDIDEKKPYVIYLEAETSETSLTNGEVPTESNIQQLEPQFDPNNPEGFLRWYFHEIWATRNYDFLWNFLSLDFRQRLDLDFSTYESIWNAVGSIEEPIEITYEGKDGISQKYRVQYTTLSLKNGYTDQRRDLYWLYFNASKGHWEFK
jgi:hypothetical protein